MQKTSSNIYFPNLPRITQITNAHCGPATIKMLMANVHSDVSQEMVLQAANSTLKRLGKYGMNIYEMALAVSNLSSSLKFWFKDNADISEIETILFKHKYPVGVEWQGEFLQYSDGDTGHYSIATNIDHDENIIYLADPYRHFAGNDRKLKINRFEELWWDENEIHNPETRRLELIKDYHVIFVVVPKSETFPVEMGMTNI